MQLIDIYSMERVKVLEFLYLMLAERDPLANISHREMPTFLQHAAFVDSKPYAAWYIINDEYSAVGNCYLSKDQFGNYAIGIHIVPAEQHRGIGRWAVQELMRMHGKQRYLANISPLNIRSQDFFRSLGFKLIQYTFEHDQN